jgi:uncharacterized protein (DUF1778 family)
MIYRKVVIHLGYNGYTEKRKASNEKYLANFVKPTIRMTEEEKRTISRGAREAGKSFNRFMIDCAIQISENMKENEKT